MLAALKQLPPSAGPLFILLASFLNIVFFFVLLFADKLLKTVIHVIMILSATKNYRGLVAVKKLLRSCYGYPSDGYDSKALANELLGLLKGKTKFIIFCCC